RRDHGFQAFEDAQRHLASAVARVLVAVIDLAIRKSPDRPAPRIAIEGVGAEREVRARAEAAARAGDDDRADVVVAIGCIERLYQLALHGRGEGVELV